MLEVKVNQQSVVELNNNLNQVKKSLEEISSEDGIKDLNKNLEDVNNTTTATIKTISSLEETLSSLNDELANTEIGTKAYRDLEKQVIGVSGELKNLELAREALDNEQFASEAKSVAGGLGDIAGGLTLIGASSGSVEKIVQTIAQVEGITKAATGAIEAYSSGVKIVNSLVAKGAAIQKAMATATAVQTAATGAQASATAGATTTQLGLNAAMLANPIFLLIAGLAALVAAFVLFSGSAETAEASNDALNIVLERQAGILDRLNEKNVRNAQNNIDLAKARGASAKEIFDLEIQLLAEEELARKKDIQQAQITIDTKRRLKEIAIKEGNDEARDARIEEIRGEQEKLAILLNLNGQYRVDVEKLTTQFETNQTNEQNRKNEENRKKSQDAYKKRLSDQEKYNSDRLAAVRKIKDLELSLLEDGISKDTQISQEKTKRDIEDLEKQYGPIKNLNKVQLEELNTLKNLLTNQGNANIKEINDKYNKIDLDNRKAFAEEIKKLIGTEGANKKELLDLQYQDDLTALQKKIDDEIYTIEEGNRIKAQLQSNLNGAKAKVDAEYAAREKAAFLELNATDLEGKLNQLENNRLLELDNKELTESEIALIEKKYADERQRLAKEELDAKLALVGEYATGVSEALSYISDTANNIFETQNAERQAEHEKELSNLEEGSDAYNKAKARQVVEDDKAAKKQFEINKKLQIAQAVVQGVQAVLAAYSSGSAIPVVGAVTGPLFAGLAAIAAASNVAKIKNSTYQSGGGSSTSAPSTPNISSSIQAAQPQFNLFGQGNDANTVGPGANQNDNQNITVNAEVSVSEINEVQNKVAVQEDRATL